MCVSPIIPLPPEAEMFCGLRVALIYESSMAMSASQFTPRWRHGGFHKCGYPYHLFTDGIFPETNNPFWLPPLNV